MVVRVERRRRRQLIMFFQREFGFELGSAGHRPRASPASHHRITQTCGQSPCLDTAAWMQLLLHRQGMTMYSHWNRSVWCHTEAFFFFSNMNYRPPGLLCVLLQRLYIKQINTA